MESNRDSARRSRMRKRQHLDDLLNDVTLLKNENSRIEMQMNMYTQDYVAMNSKNTIMRSEVMELIDRLKYLNSVLHFVEEFSGMAMDIPEIPDPLLKPWQHFCLSHPIIADANMLQ
ncbi:bZIP transcription factor 53-like [Phalaenopsis equestris]|uniref:bZIP transcription factor 53-like n=1 Tax=Phalaenopsis equestris TaxID=78828 RepID=UPI0009E190ED|nr:bZIP transcription factor 53-like [Phalaenopsis equestris]XP_020596085.1 bZIP transcription factor 53-like [Phalaenopsis equestris]